MILSIELPIKLESEANARGHTRWKSSRVKDQRETVARAVRAHLAGRAIEFPISVTITRIAPRSLDDDNLIGSAKAVRDGIADAIGVNDRDKRVTWFVMQEQRTKLYAVKIEIEHGSRCPACRREA